VPLPRLPYAAAAALAGRYLRPRRFTQAPPRYDRVALRKDGDVRHARYRPEQFDMIGLHDFNLIAYAAGSAS
jgi:hypothetical protein